MRIRTSYCCWLMSLESVAVIPVFNDFALFIQAEHVDACPITVSRPLLKAVQNDVIARIAPSHVFESRI
jgi:hypothetical protein